MVPKDGSAMTVMQRVAGAQGGGTFGGSAALVLLQSAEMLAPA